MKTTIFLLMCLVLPAAGCAPVPTLNRSAEGPLGKISRSEIPEWFLAPYDSAHVDEDFIDLMKDAHDGIDIVVFMGMWCSDSKRDIPLFLKIADRAGIPAGRMTMYSVDRTKKTDDGATERYGIEKVPTFIFFKKGTEVGRIVETPRTSLAGDIVAIFAHAAKQ